MSVAGPFYPVNESIGYPLSWNISSGGGSQVMQGGGGGGGGGSATSSSSINEGVGAGGGASGFSPAVIAIVALLGTAFLLISSYRIIMSYCKCYCCCCYGIGGGTGRGRLRRTRSSLDSFDFNGGGFVGDESSDSYYHSRGSNFGVDEAMLKTLPILTYGEYNRENTLSDHPNYSPGHNPRSSPSPSCSNGLELGCRHGVLGVVGGTECAVCLGEFQYREALRLLPMCNHTFHVGCIDVWLRAHSRCPLCRAPIFSPAFSPPLPSFFSPAFSPPPPPIFRQAFLLPPPPPPPWLLLSLSTREEDIENPVVTGGNTSLNPDGGRNIATLELQEEQGVVPLPDPPRISSSANQSPLWVPSITIGSPSLGTLEEERWGRRGAILDPPRLSLSAMRSPLRVFPNVIGNPSQNLATLEERQGVGGSIPDPPRFSLSALRSPLRLLPRSLSVGTSCPDILKGAPSSSLFSPPPLSSISPWSSNLRRWASPSPSRLPWKSSHVTADMDQASLEARASISSFGGRIGQGRYHSLLKSEPHRHSCSSFPTYFGGAQSTNSKRLAGLRSPRATFIFKRSLSVGRHFAHRTNQTE